MTDTRQRLLDATRRCIAAKGLAATTSRDITGEAGANLAAITYHYCSKDDLVAEALLASLRSWLTPALDVLGGAGDPASRAIVAIQTLMASFAQHRDEAPAFLQALVEAPRIAPLQAGVVRLWDDLCELLAGHISEMQGRGELGSWVEPQAMSALLVAVANGLVLQVTTDPDGPGLDAMAAQFGGLLLAARTA
jgi:AcrR family transcriptional regulator